MLSKTYELHDDDTGDIDDEATTDDSAVFKISSKFSDDVSAVTEETGTTGSVYSIRQPNRSELISNTGNSDLREDQIDEEPFQISIK